MAYEPHEWVNDVTDITAERMNHIEQGVKAVENEKADKSEIPDISGKADKSYVDTELGKKQDKLTSASQVAVSKVFAGEFVNDGDVYVRINGDIIGSGDYDELPKLYGFDKVQAKKIEATDVLEVTSDEYPEKVHIVNDAIYLKDADGNDNIYLSTDGGGVFDNLWLPGDESEVYINTSDVTIQSAGSSKPIHKLSEKANASDVISNTLPVIGDDANNYYEKAGLYYCWGGMANVPASYGYLQVLPSSNPAYYCRQIFYEALGNGIYTRSKIEGVWTNWVEIATNQLYSVNNTFTMEQGKMYECFNTHPYGHTFYAIVSWHYGQGINARIISDPDNDYSISVNGMNVTITSQSTMLWLNVRKTNIPQA